MANHVSIKELEFWDAYNKQEQKKALKDKKIHQHIPQRQLKIDRKVLGIINHTIPSAYNHSKTKDDTLAQKWHITNIDD